ncbi:PLPL1 protein, partial [Anhinga anhinga]|nr:PLPL1 protein [Anhinga anhinga]
SFSILIRGCGFFLPYEFGAFRALQELSPDLMKSASRIYGASSGSLVATFALCGCDAGKSYALPFILNDIKLATLNALKSSFWSLFRGQKLIKILRDLLNCFLPPNAHQLVSGKLHVIITRVSDWRSIVVSEFASKEDLIQALICSCFVPVYFGLLPPVYHGVRYVDGEIGMWCANFVSRNTITISAFAGEYDICPREGPAAFFTFHISDCSLQISKRNICRFQHIL